MFQFHVTVQYSLGWIPWNDVDISHIQVVTPTTTLQWLPSVLCRHICKHFVNTFFLHISPYIILIEKWADQHHIILMQWFKCTARLTMSYDVISYEHMDHREKAIWCHIIWSHGTIQTVCCASYLPKLTIITLHVFKNIWTFSFMFGFDFSIQTHQPVVRSGLQIQPRWQIQYNYKWIHNINA